MSWVDDSRLHEFPDGRFAGHLPQHWKSLQGMHGGLVAALAVRGADKHVNDLGAPTDCTLRAATFGFVRGSVAGDVTLAVELVRRGRALVTTHVAVTQNDRTLIVARCHHSTPWHGDEYSDVAPPLERPDGAVRLDTGARGHLDNVETWLHPSTVPFGGGARAEWIAWCRPKADHAIDAAWLAMFGDYFPPAVFARRTQPSRAVSIEYSIQIHRANKEWTLADDEYLAARVHAFHSNDGFAVEDGLIHAADGTLVATTRQVRLA